MPAFYNKDFMHITIAIFILVYLVMGMGHLPWLKVDRTGAALLGAMLLIVSNRITPEAAWGAIDVNTIGLLFGLMVVSAAFVAGGFYDWTAKRVGELKVGPRMLLAILIAVSGILSALLTNDVVMVAMTPVLCAITFARRLNPIPFLLGFCFAANIGSTGTLIGSPRNMILGQMLDLSFNDFSRITLLPTIISLALSWVVLVLFYRNRWQLESMDPSSTQASVNSMPSTPVRPLNIIETSKATLVTLVLIAAFVFTDWSHMSIAMGAACLLLLNRKIASSDMLKHVDINLLLMLMGLFVVNASMTATGLPEEAVTWLRHIGINLYSPIQLFFISAGVSDIVGNNPTIMLFAPFITDAAHGETLLGAAISMGTGFASNAILFGSLSGIIVAEQAKLYGITISFMQFMRAGLPITIMSMVLAVSWIYYLS